MDGFGEANEERLILRDLLTEDEFPAVRWGWSQDARGRKAQWKSRSQSKSWSQKRQGAVGDGDKERRRATRLV